MGLVSEDPRMIAGEGSLGWILVQIHLGMHVGRDEGAARLPKCENRVVPAHGVDDGKMEQASRGGAHAFAGPRVDAVSREDDAVGTGSISRADDRAGIAGVACLDEDDDQPVTRLGGRCDQGLGQPDARQVGDGDQTLRGDRLGQRSRRVLGDLMNRGGGRQSGEQRAVASPCRGGRKHLADDTRRDRRAHRRRTFEQDQPALAAPAAAQQLAGSGHPTAADPENRLVQCRKPQAAGAA